MEIEKESDADLLVLMSIREDKQSADAAHVFYRRHVEALFSRIRSTFGRQLTVQVVEELVVDTFQRAWERAGRFTPQHADPAVQRLQVVAWLNRIANRIFLDEVRRRAGTPVQPFPEDFPEPADRETPAPDESLQRSRARIAREVLDGLDELERTVLIETARWMDIDTGKSRMPKGVAKELADRLGISTMNLRQIRRRVFDKFEMRLRERLTERDAT
jgi:RNA polymerase sigma factor (sigma-70 family)